MRFLAVTSRGATLTAILAAATGCRSAAPSNAAREQAVPVAAVARYDPSRDLGPLFQQVQLAGLFSDSKTFVDARPRQASAMIVQQYALQSRAAAFSLRPFVEQHFELPMLGSETFRSDTTRTMDQHIRALWP